MVELKAYIKLRARLLSVVDPIAPCRFFIRLTEHRSSEERQRIVFVCAMSVSRLIAHKGGKLASVFLTPVNEKTRLVFSEASFATLSDIVIVIFKSVTPSWIA